MALSSHRVVTVSRPELTYYEQPPFDPPNPVYEAVENLFRELGMDRARAGTPDWNPLGDLIAPGDKVVIKPNLVSSRNLHERIEGHKLRASSTHGSLLRPVLDYALRACGPRGQVRVIDSPVEGCEIEKVAVPLGIFAAIESLAAKGHNVGFVDLRTFRVAPMFALDDVRVGGRSWNLGMLVRRRLAGDPHGYQTVDVSNESFFSSHPAPLDKLRFHRSHYDTPVPHHTARTNEYSIPRTVLEADVVINLAKMKTHKKTGVTLALKSVIGLTNQKYWLPHFTEGPPSEGGDEFDHDPRFDERLERRLSRLPIAGGHSVVARAPKLRSPPRIIDGSWEGNFTLWRTILDLNRILFHAGKDGRMRGTQQRRYLAIVDGIVAGEGEGPLGASPVDAGLLVAGTDPSLVDFVACEAMGLDPMRIRLVRESLEGAVLPSGIAQSVERVFDGPRPARRFRAPRSWPSLVANA